MAGNAAQTSSEMPAKISFLRPVAVMAWATLASSKAFTDERSMIGTPGSASTSSGKVGPHMLSRAVVVTMITISGPWPLWPARTRCASALPSNANPSHEADLVIDKDERGVFRSKRLVGTCWIGHDIFLQKESKLWLRRAVPTPNVVAGFLVTI